MLIDATHKRWILGTFLAAILVTAGYLVLDRLAPDGVTPRSTAGLLYAIAGSLLMVYAGSLSALRRVPAWTWLGARKAWLRGHIWLGLLSGVLILCHSGFGLGGPLTTALMAVLGLTLFTGAFGLFLQHLLPRLITTRVVAETPYEQIPHVCHVMRRKADTALAAMWLAGPDQGEVSAASYQSTQAGIGARVQFQEFYEQQVRPFLAEDYRRSLVLSNPLRAEAAFARLRALPGLADLKEEVTLLESLCDERRQLAEQERLHFWLHGWLLLHIPLSLLLLVLGVAHVVSALYY